MNRDFKYNLNPQWKTYDRIGYKWLPFIMFNQTPNFRSDILNTDNKGFRYNSKSLIQKNSIFETVNKDKVTLLSGGSFAFGAGATLDQNTISGYLSRSGINCLNLSGSAHIGFQELISIFSNINLIKNVKEIIFISGINDLYLSNFFGTDYPDSFYFNSEFKENMNKKRINFKKKIFKFLANSFYPNVLDNNNIENFKKEDFYKFIKSPEFRKSFQKEDILKLSMEEKLDRNFKIYKMLGNYFNCKISFYLQPALNWSKEKSKEEQQLFDYTNLFFKEKTIFFNKLFSKDNYNYFKNLLDKISKKNDISFFDLNDYFRQDLKKEDWIFLDSVHVNDNGNKLISDIIRKK